MALELVGALNHLAGTEGLEAAGAANALAEASETRLLDLAYPVGSVATINAGYAWELSGATMPEVGANGGSFLAFAAGATESAVFGLGSHIPRTWRTVDLYLETFNLTGGTGDVVWQVNVNSGGNVETTQAVTADIIQTVFKIGGQTYSLNSNTIAGVQKFGATIVVSRLGADEDDDFAGDINLASLHAVRVT